MQGLLDRQVLFFGGKGGVGKTTCAAAMALGASRVGKRVLLVSTDPAHSTSDIFERRIGPEPVQVQGGLWGLEIDAATESARYVGEVKDRVAHAVRPLDPQGSVQADRPGGLDARRRGGGALRPDGPADPRRGPALRPGDLRHRPHGPHAASHPHARADGGVGAGADAVAPGDARRRGRRQGRPDPQVAVRALRSPAVAAGPPGRRTDHRVRAGADSRASADRGDRPGAGPARRHRRARRRAGREPGAARGHDRRVPAGAPGSGTHLSRRDRATVRRPAARRAAAVPQGRLRTGQPGADRRRAAGRHRIPV